MFPLRKTASAAILVVVLAGCSRSIDATPPEVFPVSGTITCRGEPIAEALLTFWPADKSEPAFALADRQGRFRCLTNDTDGIAPGEYAVTVSRPEGGIPRKYAEAETTPLYVEIDREDANLLIQLDD